MGNFFEEINYMIKGFVFVFGDHLEWGKEFGCEELEIIFIQKVMEGDEYCGWLEITITFWDMGKIDFLMLEYGDL